MQAEDETIKIPQTYFIYGKLGSGKTAIGRAFAERTALPRLEVSDVVKSLMKATDRQALQSSIDKSDVVEQIKEHIVQFALQSSNGCIICGGREPRQLVALEEQYPKIVVRRIAICANEYTRYTRLLQRDGCSVEEFYKYEERDRKIGIDILMAAPNALEIQNDGSIQDAVSALCRAVGIRTGDSA